GELAGIGAAQIEAVDDLAGNDVAGRMGNAQLPHCGYQPLAVPEGKRLRGKHKLGRGGQRILAQGHGHGARVAGHAVP
nr:hypothetical protein [Tanacetum cinerariifolium]